MSNHTSTLLFPDATYSIGGNYGQNAIFTSNIVIAMQKLPPILRYILPNHLKINAIISPATTGPYRKPIKELIKKYFKSFSRFCSPLRKSSLVATPSKELFNISACALACPGVKPDATNLSNVCNVSICAILTLFLTYYYNYYYCWKYHPKNIVTFRHRQLPYFSMVSSSFFFIRKFFYFFFNPLSHLFISFSQINAHFPSCFFWHSYRKHYILILIVCFVFLHLMSPVVDYIDIINTVKHLIVNVFILLLTYILHVCFNYFINSAVCRLDGSTHRSQLNLNRRLSHV